MGLALIFSPGDKFFIGDDEFEVLEVDPSSGSTLKGPAGETHHISRDNSTEIASSVFVSEGRSSGPDQVRIVFEAPAEIVILRESIYRSRAL